MTKRKRPSDGSRRLDFEVFDAQYQIAGPNYRARFEGLYWASREIGDTNADRLRWLVRLVNVDLAKAHPATMDVVGDQLVVFGAWSLPSNFRGGVELPPTLDRKDVVRIHENLRALVRGAVTSPTGQPGPVFEAGGVQFSLVRATAPGVKPAQWGYSLGGPLDALILTKARDLIFSTGRDLLGCGYCRGPFIAVRRQKFCTEACAQKERNDRKKNRPASRRGSHGQATRTR